MLPSEQVVGVPVTLYGDLKNQFVETNVGFDSVCKVSPNQGNEISHCYH